MEQVAQMAASEGVALEINSAADRLDLSDVNARLARERGCRFVIDTDAHSTNALENLRFGVFQARRAGLTAADVWNTQPWARFSGSLGARRNAPRKPAAAKPASGGKSVAAKPAAKPAAARTTKKAAPKAPAAKARRKS
jgi:hypothetical protein